MAQKPLITAALGARGTGKSAWCKQQLQRIKPGRLAVWDLMQEYSGLVQFSDLGAFIRAMKAKRFAIAFHPSRNDETREAQFDIFCRAMLQAGHLVVMVEELAFVTKPNKAPGAWREMTLLGRHEKHSLSIFGTSQRPASIDKDFLANADLVHCGRLAYEPDAAKAAMVLGVRADELLRLPDLAWVERRAGDIEATRGKLVFAAGAAASGKPPKAANSTGKPRGVKVAPPDRNPNPEPRT